MNMWTVWIIRNLCLSSHINSNHHPVHCFPSLDYLVTHELKHIMKHTLSEKHTLSHRETHTILTHLAPLLHLTLERFRTSGWKRPQAGEMRCTDQVLNKLRGTSEMLWLGKRSRSMKQSQWLVNYPFMPDIAQSLWLAPGGVRGVMWWIQERIHHCNYIWPALKLICVGAVRNCTANWLIPTYLSCCILYAGSISALPQPSLLSNRIVTKTKSEM